MERLKLELRELNQEIDRTADKLKTLKKKRLKIEGAIDLSQDMQPEGEPMNQTEKEKALEQAASLMKRLLPLAKLIASDEFTEDERSRFNEATGHVPFHLSNALIPLCGKDPREEMTRQRDFLKKYGIYRYYSSIKDTLSDLRGRKWKRPLNRK
jgi:cell division septum initiation protein DivIVA